jgi:hypothetical protein
VSRREAKEETPDIAIVKIVEGRLARIEGGRNEVFGHRRDFRIVTM